MVATGTCLEPATTMPNIERGSTISNGSAVGASASRLVEISVVGADY